ncbi:MAG: TIR domain-containing protein [Gammaproteobacteria bacterium]|nr:TIR domain-containing protein [Gammaproteobacteria bacterium]MBV8404196.1 TIR domain-containing protein [Gammaproteobacteria bacterium]
MFLSYASQDAAAAACICTALREVGVEVWFDQTELRGGDMWDQRIRREIRECTLFMPVISANTASRHEGYFRLEWDLADRRTHMMARDRAFIVPVCVDATKEGGTDVPESFHRVQWMRLPHGNTGPMFTARIVALLGTPASAANLTPSDATTGIVRAPAFTPVATAKSTLRKNRLAIAFMATITVILGYVAVDRLRPSNHTAGKPGATVAPARTPAMPAIPEKSVAVLPFVDMSEKKDQEYFSDGLSEELIDMLAKIPELHVPARTSSFYFKAKQATIADIGKALSVANVLEGSVRKSGRMLRITAQLVHADSGYHLWSETYDRKLDDIFKTQDEIAGAVVKALKVSLLTEQPQLARLTTSNQAYELYLRARALISRDNSDDTLKAYEDLQRAVALDSKFTLAWASLADILSKTYAEWYRVFPHGGLPAPTEGDPLHDWRLILTQMRAAAHTAAEQALRNAPGLAEGHLAMGQVLWRFDSAWTAAETQIAMARELEPGNARILLEAAELNINLGRVPEGIQLAQRAAALDPLGRASFIVAWGQFVAGAVDEAQLSLQRYIELYPTASRVHYRNALLLLARGLHDAALTEVERETLARYREAGLPLALDAAGRRSDADRALEVAERRDGNAMAYQIAYIYANRMDLDRAFDWLERAYRQGDPGMCQLKVDPMFRNLRGDPRYTALLDKMRLSDSRP